MRADREKLRQILLNLLANAVKFTAAGGRVRMTLRGRRGDARRRSRVRDTGRRHPADKLEAMFEPFVQVDARTLTRQQEGSGSGWRSAATWRAAMGGDLTVRERGGRGVARSRSPCRGALTRRVAGERAESAGGEDRAAP